MKKGHPLLFLIVHFLLAQKTNQKRAPLDFFNGIWLHSLGETANSAFGFRQLFLLSSLACQTPKNRKGV